MPIDLFVPIIIVLMFVAFFGATLIGLASIFWLGIDWYDERSVRRRLQAQTSALQDATDIAPCAIFVSYLVAALQGRSEVPKPTYIVSRLLELAELYPSQRKRLVREAIRAAKKADLDAGVIIGHVDPVTLHEVMPSMRKEVDGMEHADRLLAYAEPTEVSH